MIQRQEQGVKMEQSKVRLNLTRTDRVGVNMEYKR